MAVATIAVSLAGAGAGIAATSTVTASATSATTTTVTIPTSQTWTDTGIAVTTGQSVTIAMSGSYTYSAGNTTGPKGKKFFQNNCGATQYGNPPTSSFPFPVYGINCWGSIFRIGSSGIPFPTGLNITFSAPVSGELFIGINDNYLADNSGNLTATITH